MQEPPTNSSNEHFIVSLGKLLLGLAALAGIPFLLYLYGPELKRFASTLPGVTDTNPASPGREDTRQPIQTDPTPQLASRESQGKMPSRAPLSTDLSKLENPEWLRSRHETTYKEIKNLPWVKDGWTQQEAHSTQDRRSAGVKTTKRSTRAIRSKLPAVPSTWTWPRRTWPTTTNTAATASTAAVRSSPKTAWPGAR